MYSHSDRFEINIDHLELGNNFVHITSADTSTLVLEAAEIKITLDRERKEISFLIVTLGQGTYVRRYDMLIHPFSDNFESYIKGLSDSYIKFAYIYAEKFKNWKFNRNPSYMQPYTTLFINDVGGSHLANYGETHALARYESFLITLSKKVFNNLSIEDEVMLFRTSQKMHELLAPIEPAYPTIDPDNEFTLVAADSAKLDKPSKPSKLVFTRFVERPQNSISTSLRMKMLQDDILTLVMKKYTFPNRYSELKFNGQKRVRLAEKNNPSSEERADKVTLKSLNEQLAKLAVTLSNEKKEIPR